MNQTKLILLVAFTTIAYYSAVYLYWDISFNLITGTLFAIATICYAVLLFCSIAIANQITKQEDAEWDSRKK